MCVCSWNKSVTSIRTHTSPYLNIKDKISHTVREQGLDWYLVSSPSQCLMNPAASRVLWGVPLYDEVLRGIIWSYRPVSFIFYQVSTVRPRIYFGVSVRVTLESKKVEF